MRKALRQSVTRFLREEDGPTATEYAVMFSIILLGLIAAVKTIGSKANAHFNSASQGW